ncbi:type II toxin-antitoxin system VapB family antitoxin [Pedobacter endophyticus]|uniref:DUF2281 domain-containing protein n=1 Tax=Pedobacter endophyticus TaxID=2789740 RepID=A0A7S9L1I4_9SPHI|nr:DUF2281 domain-containing protein [Pedobacter endophyticus]QPH40771.1 DUF2281 domain-containing protein [Pedobacter endophyticus]
MTDIQLYTKLSDLPTDLKDKVSNYIDSLLEKKHSVKANKKRVAGLAEGLIDLKTNFDDPIEGFENYMK